MPNWCEGTLKVRGTKEKLTKFILNGLQPVGFLGEEKSKINLNEHGDIKTKETCWIENTSRGFVDGLYIDLSEFEDNEICVVTLEARFAWGINADELLKTAIKYQVDMKIYAFERGMQFNQDIEIISGKIAKDNEIKFDDYEWECPSPNMGG